MLIFFRSKRCCPAPISAPISSLLELFPQNIAAFFNFLRKQVLISFSQLCFSCIAWRHNSHSYRIFFIFSLFPIALYCLRQGCGTWNEESVKFWVWVRVFGKTPTLIVLFKETRNSKFVFWQNRTFFQNLHFITFFFGLL